MTRVRVTRLVSAALAVAALASCINGGGNPFEVEPGPANLVMSFSPSPAPTAGQASCRGSAIAKTWEYSLTIQNRGSEPFEVSEVWRQISQTGSFEPRDAVAIDDLPSYYTEKFGGATIAGGQTVRADICWVSNKATEYVRYQLKNAAGTSFVTPTLHLLP